MSIRTAIDSLTDWLGGGQVVNVQTGAGGPTDPATTQMLRAPRPLVKSDVEAACRSGIYARLCGQLALTALADPPQIITGDPNLAETLNTRADDLGAWAHLRWAAACAQRQGIGALFVVTDDADVDLAQPIPEGSKVTRFERLRRWDVRPQSWETRLESPRCGQPRMLEVSLIIAGQRRPWVPVHPSRVVLLRGDQSDTDSVKPTAIDAWDSYGIPLQDRLRTILPLLMTLERESSRIVQNLGIVTKTLSDQGMARLIAAAGADNLDDYLTVMRKKLSAAGLLVNLPGESITRLPASANEYEPVEQGIYRLTALTLGWPVELVNGQPPPGLGDNAKGARIVLGSLVGAYADESLRPGANQIVDLLLREQGNPRTATVVFGDPIPRTASERAQIRLSHTQADALAVQAGILPADYAAKRYSTAEWSDELPPLEMAEDGASALLREELRRIAEATASAEQGDDRATDAETYLPPESAQNNARKVLAWREEHGEAVQGMTRTGWTRANQLASGERLSRETVGRMAAFARHRSNAEVAEEYRDEPWRDAGYVAWLGWGGTTGIEWAAEIVDREDD